MQPSLFPQCETIQLPTIDGQPSGELHYYAGVFQPQAQRWLQQLLAEVEWQQDNIRIAGKWIAVPRLQAWYGEFGHTYQYSGIKLVPEPWQGSVAEIREQVETLLQKNFNAVLVNLYRNGLDSVSWHADDEPELGERPVIASLSLGATRRFSMKPKAAGKAKPIHLELAAGSLLVMGAGVQEAWLHAVPKQSEISGQRINLTFRSIALL